MRETDPRNAATQIDSSEVMNFLSGEILFADAQLTSNVASLLSGFVERLITVAGRSYQAFRQER